MKINCVGGVLHRLDCHNKQYPYVIAIHCTWNGAPPRDLQTISEMYF